MINFFINKFYNSDHRLYREKIKNNENHKTKIAVNTLFLINKGKRFMIKTAILKVIKGAQRLYQGTGMIVTANMHLQSHPHIAAY